MFVYAESCKEEILENGVKRKIKGWTEDLMLVELTWKKGMEGAAHKHSHRQACYILKGSFEATVDGEKSLLRAGDCFYTEANILHGLVALEDESICLDVFTPKREDFIA